METRESSSAGRGDAKKLSLELAIPLWHSCSWAPVLAAGLTVTGKQTDSGQWALLYKMSQTNKGFSIQISLLPRIYFISLINKPTLTTMSRAFIQHNTNEKETLMFEL